MKQHHDSRLKCLALSLYPFFKNPFNARCIWTITLSPGSDCVLVASLSLSYTSLHALQTYPLTALTFGIYNKVNWSVVFVTPIHFIELCIQPQHTTQIIQVVGPYWFAQPAVFHYRTNRYEIYS